MANKPFDYTVINPLERPTSSDLNQLQGEAHADSRFLAQELFYTLNGISNGPTNGVFPQSFFVNPTSPPSLAVTLTGGLGYQTGAAEVAIGGIAGLNDTFPYKAIYLSQDTPISIPSLPSAGNHRYDLIQIRALTGSERLTDSTTTDIYNPSLNSFGGATRYKTLTTDLAGQTVQVIASTGMPTAPLSYVTGQETAIISGLPTPPSVAAGYLPVALVLVTDTTTTITAGAITDQRPFLSFSSAFLPSYGVDTIPYSAIQTVRESTSVLSYTATTSVFTKFADVSALVTTGNVSFGLMPVQGGALCSMTLSNAGPDTTAAAEIRYNISGPGSFSQTYLQRFTCNAATAIPISPPPVVFAAVATGTCIINAYARVITTGDTLDMDNFQLCVWQG